ncbi:MAG TPA: HAD-IA family hydrolase [Blastocatellia bacterium]|jgi:haloacid dehalogenase superfamily, subfamily IA, variant 1 with third motif having Dx(3-4)D or Dx(3-4)E/REG-2-like, HAD superfamily (subfamily IA) hydrolase
MPVHEVKVIFFDAAGTLIETRGCVGEIYLRAAREFGFEAEPRILQLNFERSFRRQPPLAFPVGTPETALIELEKGWWRDLVRAVFDGLGSFPRFEDFFDELFERFRDREFWRVYDDVEPALAELKRLGLKLGVISNFDSRLYDVLRACRLDHFFDSIHISTRVGAAKPDPVIFQAALNHYAVEGRQAWHVGDSLREDVEGAMAAGLNAALIDRDDRFAENSPAPRITNLEQLATLFAL